MYGSPRNNVLRTVFVIGLFSSLFSSAQRIKSFNLFQVKNTVVVDFVIGPGSECSGYTIYQGTDSLNLNPVLDIPGICGGSGSNEEKKETHSSPAQNVVNYYKVMLNPYQETSSVKSIYVSTNANAKLLAFPNPVYRYEDPLTVKLFNANNVHVVGFLLNQFGNILRNLDLTTKVDLATIDIGELNNGMYVVWLTDGQQVFFSKFIIKR
jgi:hypothetical protein